jgi:hypothetical protein
MERPVVRSWQRYRSQKPTAKANEQINDVPQSFLIISPFARSKSKTMSIPSPLSVKIKN